MIRGKSTDAAGGFTNRYRHTVICISGIAKPPSGTTLTPAPLRERRYRGLGQYYSSFAAGIRLRVRGEDLVNTTAIRVCQPGPLAFQIAIERMNNITAPS